MIRGCFEHSVPITLSSGDWHKPKINIISGEVILRAGELVIRALDNGCINYALPWASLNPRGLSSSGKLLDTQQWLWLPQTGNFKLTSDIPLSLPLAESDGAWSLSQKLLRWPSRTMLGKFKQFTYPVFDSRLAIAVANVADKDKAHALADWAYLAASAAAKVTGKLPQAHIQVLIFNQGKQREPVPWGEVQRGGSASVHLFVDATRPFGEFIADWTAPHEFSHLLLPKTSYKDRWLAEGLASYYQYQARASAGTISEATAWHGLMRGFKQGEQQAKTLSLAEAKGIKHIYWGGAAIWLLADLVLRKKDMSLGQALAQFHACCYHQREIYSAKSLFQQLDTITKTKVFMTLYQTKVIRPGFPLSQHTLMQLRRDDPEFTRLMAPVAHSQ